MAPTAAIRKLLEQITGIVPTTPNPHGVTSFPFFGSAEDANAFYDQGSLDGQPMWKTLPPRDRAPVGTIADDDQMELPFTDSPFGLPFALQPQDRGATGDLMRLLQANMGEKVTPELFAAAEKEGGLDFALGPRRPSPMKKPEPQFHYTTADQPFSAFDPQRLKDSGQPVFDRIGTHVGTEAAATERAGSRIADGEGHMRELLLDTSKPLTPKKALALATKLPANHPGRTYAREAAQTAMKANPDVWENEGGLNYFLRAVRNGGQQYPNTADATRAMSKGLGEAGYTNIPYRNAVEDVGSVSNIALTERGRGKAVVRDVDAYNHPQLRHLPNLMAGAAGAGVMLPAVLGAPGSAEAAELRGYLGTTEPTPREASRTKLFEGLDAIAKATPGPAPVDGFMPPPRADAPEGRTIPKPAPAPGPSVFSVDGQKRRAALDAFNQTADEAMRYYLPPGVSERLGLLLPDPVGSTQRSMEASGEMLAPGRTPSQRARSAVDMVGNLGWAALDAGGVGLGARPLGKALANEGEDALRAFGASEYGGLGKAPAGASTAAPARAKKAAGGTDGQRTGTGPGASPATPEGAADGVLGAGDYVARTGPLRPRSGFVGGAGTRGYSAGGDPRDWSSLVGFRPTDEMLAALQDLPDAPSTPTWNRLPSTPEARDRFAEGLAGAKASQGPYGAAVDANPAETYAGSQIFEAEDGKGYFAVAPDGEINAVASRKGGGIRGLPDTALNVATQNGGRWLSVFDTDVAAKYARSGFRPVARVPFDPDYAPTGWDAEAMGRYNGGQPDVVFMEYDPSYTGGYKPGQAAADDLPVLDYDGAGALMRDRAGREQLADFFRVKGADMDLKGPKRKAADSVQGVGYVDRDFGTPAPGASTEDLSLKYPRNPNPAAKLPKGDRARFMVDNRKDLAAYITEKIKASGQVGSDTQKFYHSDGPLYRAALKAGLSPEEARQYLDDFGAIMGATSPRTKVLPNIQNTTAVMAKQNFDMPLDVPIGVQGRTGMDGGPSMNEQGYPMIMGEGGDHRRLLDDLKSGRGIDVHKNTKPANFGPNVQGNRSSVTVDTHAIRGTLLAANEMRPGMIPDAYILPKFKKQYAADPAKLQSDWLDDSIESQMIDTPAGRKAAQTEYPVFADVIHDVAKNLGVDPAEAQSMMWFGFGDKTNLGSLPKTVSQVFDDRLKATSDLLGIPVDEVAKKVFRRQIPLASLGTGAIGLGAGGGISMLNERKVA